MLNQIVSKNGLKILGNIFMLLSFFFITKKIVSFDIDFFYIIQPRTLVRIIAFSIMYSGLIYTNAFSWKLILEFISLKNISYKDTSSVYIKSNLGKYIPGNVMQFVNRNLLGISLDLNHSQIALSSVLEIVFLCLVSFFWVLVLVGKTFITIFIQRVTQINAILIFIAIVVVTLIVVASLFYMVHKKKNLFESFKLFRSKRFAKLSFRLFILNTLFFLISGTMLVFILRWEIPIDGSRILLIISSYIVSWLIGFITPGAPGGIGIREAVLTLMLSEVCGDEVILMAAIIQRIISIFGDVLAYLSSIVTKRLFSRD